MNHCRNSSGIRAEGHFYRRLGKGDGYSPGIGQQVLAGRLRRVRGQAHQVAVVLGLKAGEIGDISDLPFSGSKEEK